MGILYQKRRLKANKLKRKIASRRSSLKRLRMLLSMIIIFGIIFVSYVILNLPQWYLDEDKLMRADESILTLVGNQITHDYKIINIIRQTKLPRTQIFKLDTQELEDNISQLQTIKRVYIRRYWFPARLTVAVEERTPVFLISPNLETEPNSALTTDGVLIDHEYFPFKTPVKAKRLLTYGIKDGLDEIWDKKKVSELVNLVKALETYSNEEVQYVDYRNREDVYIMLKEYLVRFGEINDTSLKRAKSIATLLLEAQKLGNKTKYIDLRWDDSRFIKLEGESGVEKHVEKQNPNTKNQDEQEQENEQNNTTEEENDDG